VSKVPCEGTRKPPEVPDFIPPELPIDDDGLDDDARDEDDFN